MSDWGNQRGILYTTERNLWNLCKHAILWAPKEKQNHCGTSQMMNLEDASDAQESRSGTPIRNILEEILRRVPEKSQDQLPLERIPSSCAGSEPPFEDELRLPEVGSDKNEQAIGDDSLDVQLRCFEIQEDVGVKGAESLEASSGFVEILEEGAERVREEGDGAVCAHHSHEVMPPFNNLELLSQIVDCLSAIK